MGKGKPIDILSKDHFYCRTKPQIQIGLYKLFCDKYKIPAQIVVDSLEEYRLANQKSIHQSWTKEFTLEFL